MSKVPQPPDGAEKEEWLRGVREKHAQEEAEKAERVRATRERLAGEKAERLEKEIARLREEIKRLKGSNGQTHWDTADEKTIIEIVNGALVTPKAIDWQWPGWIAAGKLHLIAGAKGTKKTTIFIDFAAKITMGGFWLDGTRAPLGDVMIWSGEDDFDDTLLPRLLGAGGDPKRVHHLKGAIKNGKRRPFDPAHDVAALLEAANGITDLRMMGVDSIVSAVAGDSHKNAEVRRGLQPLVTFAAERKCSVLGLTHFTKGTVGRDPVERVTGSLAFAAQARIVLVTAKPIAEGGQHRLVRAASNIGPDGGGFEYRAMQEPLNEYDFGVQRILWGDRLEGSARDLLNDVELPKDDEGAAPKRSAAARFLSTLLANGPVPVAHIRTDADAAGLSICNNAIEQTVGKRHRFRIAFFKADPGMGGARERDHCRREIEPGRYGTPLLHRGGNDPGSASKIEHLHP